MSNLLVSQLKGRGGSRFLMNMCATVDVPWHTGGTTLPSEYGGGTAMLRCNSSHLLDSGVATPSH